MGSCQFQVAALFSSIVALFYLVEIFHLGAAAATDEVGIKRLIFSKQNNSATSFTRKLLQSTDDDPSNRIGNECSKDDIVIYQGSTVPLPDGIPSYSVQILNACVSGCSISNIHVSCGWFSSARLVNPRVFRRIFYDDCVVNDGEPLGPGETLSFQYANSFRYPLSVLSVSCC